jgi:hypothetical protein
MAADATGNPFTEGRANLRETAKWMISGAVGAATLIVGSSTISQLGAMAMDWRFAVAIVALIVAAGLCWVPFIRAVDVLRSEIFALNQFVEAKSGDLKEAADEVSKILGRQPEGGDMRAFIANYPALRSAAWRKAADDTAGLAAVQDLDSRMRICLDACISQLVAIRFGRLVDAIKFPGVVILLTFLLFTWAANPPKAIVKLFDQPYDEPLTPARLDQLKAAGVSPPVSRPEPGSSPSPRRTRARRPRS